MFGITDLYLFIIAGLLLNITPGADMLYILTNTFQKGLKAGVIATLGISTGCLIHVFLAVIGLSAILQSSPTAFLIVKYLGAIYLVYLGFSMLIKKQKKFDIDKNIDKKTIKNVFSKGVLINALNPKVAIFFITFLPQFVDIDAESKSMAFLILGLIFIFFGTIVNIVIAYFALKGSSKLSLSKFFIKLINKVTGLLFIGFAFRLAFQKA
ncbi:LysE family translocator [Arcobacter sp.]|uniref:LysE family translocator n=1 Tax=Arcobacter sp. TaxID=1872629 RepID=UPI003D0B7C57